MEGITFVWLVIFVLYFLPWFIALKRSHKNTTLIFFLNLCFGWSGVGWFACLIWASVSSAKDPSEPVVSSKSLQDAANSASIMIDGATKVA